jgi:hypothetical protein
MPTQIASKRKKWKKTGKILDNTKLKLHTPRVEKKQRDT